MTRCSQRECLGALLWCKRGQNGVTLGCTHGSKSFINSVSGANERLFIPHQPPAEVRMVRDGFQLKCKLSRFDGGIKFARFDAVADLGL